MFSFLCAIIGEFVIATDTLARTNDITSSKKTFYTDEKEICSFASYFAVAYSKLINLQYESVGWG